MRTKLFSTGRTPNGRSPNRMVLFSYGGRAVKRRDVKLSAVTSDYSEADGVKIIDYATLWSWYNENKSGESVVSERSFTPEYAKKQKSLKFLML